MISKIVAAAILVTLCVINYRNSLRNEFAFDDYLAIVNNGDVMHGSNGTDHYAEYGKLWKNDIWGKDMQAYDSHRSYRPLLVTIFKFIVHWHGGLNPSYFRIVSIAFHTMATLAVYCLSNLIFGNGNLALGTSLLFASHPVHVESVTAVVNMAEAISLTLSIISFCIFNMSSKLHDSNERVESESCVKRMGQALGGMLSIFFWFLFLGLSVLFKETGITICGIIIASSGTALLLTIKSCYRASNAKKRAGESVGTSRNSKELLHVVLRATQHWAVSNVPWLVAALSGVFLYSLLRVVLVTPRNSGNILPDAFLGNPFDINMWRELHLLISKSYLGESKLLRKAENPFSLLHGNEKTYSLMYLHFRYFYQLLWPTSLCAEYAFDCIPKISSPMDPRFLTTLGLYFFLVFSFFYLLYRVLVPTSDVLTSYVGVKEEGVQVATGRDEKLEVKKKESGSRSSNVDDEKKISPIRNNEKKGVRFDENSKNEVTKDGEITKLSNGKKSKDKKSKKEKSKIESGEESTHKNDKNESNKVAAVSSDEEIEKKKAEILSNEVNNDSNDIQPSDEDLSKTAKTIKDIVKKLPQVKKDDVIKYTYSEPWSVEYEHYLLSLVWMIVPFLPASGDVHLLDSPHLYFFNVVHSRFRFI